MALLRLTKPERVQGREGREHSDPARDGFGGGRKMEDKGTFAEGGVYMRRRLADVSDSMVV